MARPPGRLHRRLVVLLNEAGIVVKNENIEAAQGIHRQDSSSGGARWDGFGHIDGVRVNIYSLSTMTECVQIGEVRWEQDTFHLNDIEVYPNWPDEQKV